MKTTTMASTQPSDSGRGTPPTVPAASSRRMAHWNFWSASQGDDLTI